MHFPSHRWISVLFTAAALSAGGSFSAAEPATDWIDLFDGHSLAGWSVRCLPQDAGKEFWSVRHGAIECDSRGRTDHDYVWLMHGRELRDFELELEFQAFRCSAGNSGVQVRSRYDDAATAPRRGWLDGPQIDIHPPAPWRTGLIYDETRTQRRWIHPSRPNARLEALPVPAGFVFHYAEDSDRWNRLRIVCRGTTITTELNGIAIASYDGASLLDDAAHRALRVGTEGHIALQLHAKDELHMRFRSIRVRALR
jgi:hypothetical protein